MPKVTQLGLQVSGSNSLITIQRPNLTISFSETAVSDGGLFLPSSVFFGDSAPEGRASRGPGSLLAAGNFMWDLELVSPSLWTSVFSSVK